MALTIELLDQNEGLKGLDAAIKESIIKLSGNDENQVIANKLGEVHGRYDTDISEALGIQKPQGVKTYNWIKDTILPQVKQSQTFQNQVAEKETEILSLKKAIKENTGDSTLKKQLQDALDLAETQKSGFASDKLELENKYSAKEKEVTNYKVNADFAEGIVNVKFVPDTIIKPSVRKVILNAAKGAVLSEYTPEFDSEDNIIWRDKDGKIALNKSNSLSPYTFSELVLKREEVKDIIAEIKKGGNGGKGGNDPEPENTVDISSAKTQVEAGKIIDAQLMSEGKSRGTVAFDDAKDKIWREQKIGSLPIR